MPEVDLVGLKKEVEAANRAMKEWQDTREARLAELESKGSADVLFGEKIEKIEASMDAAQKQLDEAHLAIKRQSRFVAGPDGKPLDRELLDTKAQEWLKPMALRRGESVGDFGHEGMEAYKRAFDRYMRKGDRGIDDASYKALSVGSDPDGGYTVSPDMNGRIVGFVYETSEMRAYAGQQTISTDALEGLADLDEASYGWVAETGSRTETNTPELDKWRIPVHEMYANPRATQTILDDSAINMEAWLAAKVADKFARAENDAFVNGNGVNKPRGFLTYSDWTTAGTFEYGKIERFDTGVNGGFAADPAGPDVLLDAIYGLKAPYRRNANFFMNRATTKLVRKLQDSNGDYIWQPSLAAGQPSTLLGYPVAPFEDMPDPATDSLSIAFGDMREAYLIVDRIGIRTLRDPYSAKPYVQFYSTKRVGGDVVNFEALKLIEFTA